MEAETEPLCEFCKENPVFRILSLHTADEQLIERVGLCEHCWIDGGYKEHWGGICDVADSVQTVLIEAIEEFGEQIAERISKRLDDVRDKQMRELKSRLRERRK